MRNLEYPLSALYTYISDAEKANQAISSVNVGWHIEHSLLVIIKIIETVCKSDPNKYKWKFNLPRLLAFTLNSFPRGKAKAPEIVKPTQKETTDFDAMFTKTRLSIEALKNAKENQFFLHPVFGNLNKKNTFIMLDIHTRHHIHIINDIISSK
jgi:hypothetical protein